MEPEGSLLYSQPAFGLYPELNKSYPHLHNFPKTILILSYLLPGFLNSLISLDSPTKMLHTFLISPTHAMPPS